MATRSGAASEVPAEMEPEALVEWVYERLVEAYGVPPWEPDGDALGGLVATILSQHTSDVNSDRAYASLRQRFPTWEAARDAPEERAGGRHPLRRPGAHQG